jgi:hypothetical protein
MPMWLNLDSGWYPCENLVQHCWCRLRWCLRTPCSLLWALLRVWVFVQALNENVWSVWTSRRQRFGDVTFLKASSWKPSVRLTQCVWFSVRWRFPFRHGLSSGGLFVLFIYLSVFLSSCFWALGELLQLWRYDALRTEREGARALSEREDWWRFNDRKPPRFGCGHDFSDGSATSTSSSCTCVTTSQRLLRLMRTWHFKPRVLFFCLLVSPFACKLISSAHV